MNVCLLNDSFPPVIDGVANVVMNYARIMQTEKLAKVCVATPRYPDADYSSYPYKVIPYQSFDTTNIVKGYRAGNPFDLIEMEAMVDCRPDIIHTHCPVSSTLLARMLRARTDAPIVFTYHTKFDEDIARAVKGELVQKEVIKALVSNIEACDEVWVVSSGAGENLKSLGYKGEYRVMSNGVDFDKGRVSAEEVKAACDGYDLPAGVPVFLFVGRIISYKGIPIILDACAKLSAAGMDYRCVFIGKGPDEDSMKQKARELGLMDNPDATHPGKCIFTGPIYDRNVLRAWNTRADLFLFPSTYDTNGLVVREAAACGLASVLTEGSCASEGITHDRNGFLTEQNADAISSLLQEVCRDMDHVRQVGQNAMDEIYISWENSVRAAHARYAEILEMKKAGQFAMKSRGISETIQNMPIELWQEAEKLWDRETSHFENMMENVGVFWDRQTGHIEDMKDQVEVFWDQQAGRMDAVMGAVYSIRDHIHADLHEIKEEIKDELKNPFVEG